MLKCDFHIHTGSDPKDGLEYTDKSLIDKAVANGFDVLAITNHIQSTVTPELVAYADSKNILLIPGCEVNIGIKHVLVLNVSQDDISSIRTYSDLVRLKREKDVLIIAPHPYYIMPICLGKDLEKHIDIFDAVEMSFFYTKLLDRNKKACRVAKKYGKTLLFGSDSHDLKRFGKSYMMIDADKNFKSIKQAVLDGKVKIFAPPLSFAAFFKEAITSIVKYKYGGCSR